MSPKVSRLLLIATVAAGFGVVPMHGALADSGVDVVNMPAGFSNGVPGVSGDCQSNDPNHIPHTIIHANNTVTWYLKEGTHNITPAEDVASPYGHAAKWPNGVPSGDKTAPNDTVPVTFGKSGLYFYYSSTNNEGSDNHGQLHGMCGVVVVDVDITPTTTTTTPPATTPSTDPPATTPTTSAPSGPAPTTPTSPPSTHAPATAPPAPTTTTVKADKKPKDSSTTTTTTAPPAINIPPEAIIPDIAGGTATAAQNGVVQPTSTPQGDAVAVIKKKHSDNAKKLLIVTGIGIGVLGIGAGGYKWANRSSKYFPA